MKTLLFTLEFPPFYGGVANYYGNLVKHWPATGEIFVLNNNDGRLINNKLPVLKWLPAYFALRQKIKQEKIEHVLVGQILPLGAAALICAKFRRIKYSVILHGMDLAFTLKRPRKKWLAGKILRQAEKIICTNSYTAELARQTFADTERKIIAVNPGVDRNYELRITNYELKNKYNLNNKIILLSVGRLVKRKGFDMVIEALPKVFEKAPNLVYVIIGNGPEIKNYKLHDNIIIINHAANEERDNWYKACDIFIMPARNIDGDFEGFGMVYLEANLAGKPVIAGRSGGVTDAVIDGLNGLLVDSKNINDIAAAIIRLAQNPELRLKLGEQGRERAIREFNWEKQVRKIYDLFNK